MRVPFLLALILLATPAVAQPTGETLRMAVPQGYRQTKSEQRDGDWATSEWCTASQPERLLRMVGTGGAIVAPTVYRDAMEANPRGRMEESWTKAIQGREALYVVRKTFAYNPYDSDVTKWVAYLGRVQLCDPRLPDRPCLR